jgi:hypothetical protein
MADLGGASAMLQGADSDVLVFKNIASVHRARRPLGWSPLCGGVRTYRGATREAEPVGSYGESFAMVISRISCISRMRAMPCQHFVFIL